MPQITVSVRGAELVQKRLERLRAAVPLIARSRIYEAMLEIARRMKVYPPKRPHQRYERTFRLQRSWRITAVNPNGYRLVSNAVSPTGRAYPKYVVGDAKGQKQAWMHKGRWQLMKDTVLDVVGKLPKSIVDALRVSGRGVS